MHNFPFFFSFRGSVCRFGNWRRYCNFVQGGKFARRQGRQTDI